MSKEAFEFIIKESALILENQMYVSPKGFVQIKGYIDRYVEFQKKIKKLEKENAELKEKLKLKTQQEIDASINKDCLDGCRIMLNKCKESYGAKLAKAVELVEEANDIFGDILEGSYIVDSFTSQPYSLFLKTLKEPSEKGEGDDDQTRIRHASTF